MPLKRKSIFVTPFSSQKTTDTEKRLSNPKQTQTKTPAGTFLFPVSSSKVEKIQHVTPMTKNMIKQGICRVVESFPHGADPNSPTWTFLAISQTTSIGDQIDEKSQTDEEQSAEGEEELETEECLVEGDDPGDTGEERPDEIVYDYAATPAEPTEMTRNAYQKFRRNTKLMAEAIKQEVLKTIYKMHQEIMEIEERRKKLAIENADMTRRHKKQKTVTNPLQDLDKTFNKSHFEIQGNKKAVKESSKEE